jgi:hypothetical protein
MDLCPWQKTASHLLIRAVTGQMGAGKKYGDITGPAILSDYELARSDLYKRLPRL